MPYQYPIPLQLASNQHNFDTNRPTFRQEATFPGSLISAIPFLPIEINVPEIIVAIIKVFQNILGSNSPIFQMGTLPTATVAAVNQDDMTPIGMIVKNSALGQTMPIPIIVLVPYKQKLEENFLEKKLK